MSHKVRVRDPYTSEMVDVTVPDKMTTSDTPREGTPQELEDNWKLAARRYGISQADIDTFTLPQHAAMFQAAYQEATARMSRIYIKQLAELRAELEQKDITIAAKQHLLERERNERKDAELIAKEYSESYLAERKEREDVKTELLHLGIEHGEMFERATTAEAREAALREDAKFIDLLEVYLVDGEPRFAVHGYPACPAFFSTARSAIDAARAGKEPDK